MSSDARDQHLPGLDVARAFAIGLVLWHHGPMLLNAKWRLFAQPLYRWSVSGWIGVDLFFVLSGFLITGILLRARGTEKPLRRFWARRALRIFPLAFAYLELLYIVVTKFNFPPAAAYFNRWPTFAFYLSNIDIAFRQWGGDGTLDILWTLALEEQFYLFWPLIVLFLKPRQVLALCGVMALLGPLIRLWTYETLGPTAAYVATWCRVDTLAIGGALAVLYFDPTLRKHAIRAARILVLPSLAFFAWLISRPTGDRWPAPFLAWLPTVGYSLIALAFAAFVGLAAAPPKFLRPLFKNRPLAYIGKISYGLYIWHCLIGHCVRVFIAPRYPDIDTRWLLLLWLALTILAATISFYALERPFLKLKDRFELQRPSLSQE